MKPIVKPVPSLGLPLSIAATGNAFVGNVGKRFDRRWDHRR